MKIEKTHTQIAFPLNKMTIRFSRGGRRRRTGGEYFIFHRVNGKSVKAARRRQLEEVVRMQIIGNYPTLNDKRTGNYIE